MEVIRYMYLMVLWLVEVIYLMMMLFFCLMCEEFMRVVWCVGRVVGWEWGVLFV